MPDISIIIAAYRARGFIVEAVQSALTQDVTLEVLVAPDEPRERTDYTFLQDLDPRIRVLADVPAPTGPGPARNRALASARGAFIALLDADDLMSPDYLARLLPLAQTHGAAFGRTSITDWTGQELRAITAANGVADFATFASAYASFHGVARRDPMRRWLDVLAEDVLFDLETLALNGGTAPFDDGAIYRLRQHPQSATQDRDFVRDIAAGYDQLLAMIETGDTLIPEALRGGASDVLRQWAAMNARFVAARVRNADLDYQFFTTTFLQTSRIN